jgi:Endonuclease/Exonuclease/phosphatase family
VVVRIETWNVENFARPGALDGGPTIDAAYNAKLASLADAITALDPDVLAVQEVGDPAALQDLANKLAGYAHVATADPDGRGIRVGYLSNA